MQDKNDINAMAKKYKEEMMLAYSKKRIGGNPPGSVSQAPRKEEREHIPIPAPSSKIKQIEDAAAGRTQKEEKKHDMPSMPVMPEMEASEPGAEKRPEKDLSRPPMPKIPSMEEMAVTGTAEKKEKALSCPQMPEIPCADNTEEKSEKWKFLTAEELIRMEAETTQDISADISSSTDTEEQSHHQGNYDFTTAPDKEYEKEVEIFKSEHGEGYLQVEVTCGENGCPIEGAAIAVTRQAEDMDTLVYTLVTGTDGCTGAVTLPANGGKYMITVYKEGFFTVRDLDVPIFDTIKSIQPVTMTEIDKNS